MESRYGFFPKPATRYIPSPILAAINKDKTTSKPTEFAATDFAVGESKVKTQKLRLKFFIII